MTVAAAPAPIPNAPSSERRVTLRSAVMSSSLRVTVACSDTAGVLRATTISFCGKSPSTIGQGKTQVKPQLQRAAMTRAWAHKQKSSAARAPQHESAAAPSGGSPQQAFPQQAARQHDLASFVEPTRQILDAKGRAGERE